MTATRSDQLPAERLLQAATELFLRQGIRAVGIDRILSEAGAARASLYQTYGSKDALVVAYVERCHEQDSTAYEHEAADTDDPRDRILLAFDLAARAAPGRDFRGCLYLNAVTEFPDEGHPVHTAVERHREWLVRTWTAELGALGVEDPAATANRLAVLYDGGLAGSKITRSAQPIREARRMAADLVAQALRD
ncbi:TetR family transcriptional regulator [Streptacidiphilus sp. ASG 303]|uniref:TetR/AcrR family transcriptional regulator n=1 Tax=Streptacidiphilus sp. ASG 303 TaxID=2896847 RepID=UPI001E4961C5|nr:TetR family transcriptional regulator [Streptacidiphilus sp. ASG 303]MCD0484083.1 TetR family transcriptional regulator [Streptacidiphilus sp. ASG 303]